MGNVIALGIFALAAYGWVMNIVILAGEAALSTGMMLVRAAGIFVVPLGAIMGFV